MSDRQQRRVIPIAAEVRSILGNEARGEGPQIVFRGLRFGVLWDEEAGNFIARASRDERNLAAVPARHSNAEIAQTMADVIASWANRH
ncbi:hypothetical protein BIV57_17920 [Mangrovactinospora gilvigrisea]|uniref:Uncharacterized protein n=1 Tax=Mangrovactinospora gilvigrisea TaxID=1428644 RepID=A0A1J7BBT4_9ACTN|nr:hypothetical protein [Mangrovactinospora gilvigrisea]OIV36115.1 hypothetical protein BIV57_17920 [Mangrovactinospora gilvigrisea]